MVGRIFGNLLFLVHTLLAHSIVIIHSMCIKFRSIDAGELYLAINTYTTCSTHTGTVHHQRIETHRGFQVIFCRQRGHILHHNHRTNGNHLIIMFAFTVNQIAHFIGHKATKAIRAVISTNIQIISHFTHLCL